jgi:nitrate/TMAO reductase-like tetraheme cytochrome c subunit
LFSHTNFMNSCIACHETKRPAPLALVAHGGGADCAGCHRPPSWGFSHTPSPVSCVSCHETKRPAISTHLNSASVAVTTNSHYSGQDCVSCHTPVAGAFPVAWTFKHTPTQASCVACHEIKRPAAPHVTTGDCVSCHKITTWITAFSHTPIPTSCVSCHETKRPGTSVHLDVNGAAVTTQSHYTTQDCVKCHLPATGTVLPSAWSFKHTPAQASCAACHEIKRPVAPHAATGDCVSCHTTANWVATVAFNHNPTPASCVSCHETKRPTTSTHLNVLGVTLTSNSHYTGQDCASCHKPATGTYPTAWSYSHNPAQASCVACHEVKRPVAPHAATGDCVSCHTTTNWVATVAFNHNPAPTSCVSCHTKDRLTVNTGHNTKSTGHYSLVADCVSCHLSPAASSTTTWKSGSSKTCILCHLSKGINEHGSSANSGGSHSNCASCHTATKNSW